MIVKELFAKLGLDFQGDGFSEAEMALSSLTWSLAGIGAAAGGMALALAAAIKSTADAGDEANKLSQRTGASVETIQALGYAAEFSGAAIEDVTAALTFMARKGIKDLDKEFNKVADHISKMKDGGAKTQYVIEHLGRSASGLIPMLNGGSKGLADFRKEAEELGYILNKETTQASEEMNDSIDRLGKAFVGIIRQGVAPLIPMIRDLSDEALVWVKANREILKQNLARAIRLTVEAAKALWRGLKAIVAVIKSVRDNFVFFATLLTGVLLYAIYANSAALTLLALKAVVAGWVMASAGLEAAIAWGAAMWPLTLVIAAIVLLALLADDVWVTLQGGDSVINEMGPKWTKFIDAFTKENVGDPWWLRKIKELVAILTDLTNPELKGKVAKLLGSSGKKSQYADTIPSEEDQYELPDWLNIKNRKAYASNFGGDWEWFKGEILGQKDAETLEDTARKLARVPPPPMRQPFNTPPPYLMQLQDPMAPFGNAASPEASAAATVARAPPPVITPSFRVDKIEINAAPGQNPEQIAGAARDAFEQFYEEKMQQAFVHVGGQ